MQSDWKRNWPHRYYWMVNCVLGLAGIICLGVGVFAAVRLDEKTTSALALLGVGLALLFASTIERFESFKGLGIEAKQRQLRATLSQAEVILARVKELAEIAGANIIDLIRPGFPRHLKAMENGRFGGVYEQQAVYG
ncbi:hypothetical protein [Xanthomonas hydrangeae]|uniref:hypothetical protein n=1 Tax=Xanthomonas hydrangeae TaxID=2775159 RepID=UPI001E3C345A